MQNVNITNFRKDLFSYINQAIDLGETINVSAKNGNVIVISEEEFRGLQETAYLSSIPGLVTDIIEGSNTPTQELITRDWRNEI